MATNIKIDFGKKTGKKVQALHGFNGGAMTKVFTYDARPWYVEGGFPYSRMHDSEYPYGSGEFVDIPCIFKNFDADENDPASYSFAMTDEYIKQTIATGSKIFYRLGVSIEHAPTKLYVHPPKDYAKWARICEHIIRHYTEGWANGYHWNIEYWEIWNEADLDKDETNPERKRCWTSSAEEFGKFYTVAARHLKSCFPNLMIGGCGFTTSVNWFIEDFFKYISAQSPKVPMDFYSWHRYTPNPDSFVERANAARDLLIRYGYGDIPSVLDEWNYSSGGNRQNRAESYRIMKDERGAAFYAAALAALQERSDVSIATNFESDVVKEYCGIFDVDEMCIGGFTKGPDFLATVKPTKGFYAFKMFNLLYRLGDQVALTTDDESVYATAAAGDDGVGVLAANASSEAKTVAFDLTGIKGKLTVRMTDKNITNKVLNEICVGDSAKLTITLPANSFVYIGTDLPDPVVEYEVSYKFND